MRKWKDITGLRVGALVAIRPQCIGGPTRTKWVCRCDCGKEHVVALRALVSGDTRSCGCMRSENQSKAHRVHGHCLHGKRSREYVAWRSMIDRCNGHYHQPEYYSEKGIGVCRRWKSFQAFLADMGACPMGYSLDRIDNNGDYTPRNCRWATQVQQANNKSNNRMLTYSGVTQNVTQWAAQLGVKRHLLYGRIKCGWDDTRVITYPVREYIHHVMV